MKGVFVSLLLAVPAAAAFAQQPQPPAGDAVFTRACANCHRPGQTEVPPPEVLRAFTPEAIVNSLTNGKMAVQGATLTTAERAAVAQFLTGRAFAASTAPVEPVHGGDADHRSGAGAALDGLGQRRHQLPLRAAGRADRAGPAAAEAEVGVRLRGRHVLARASRRWPAASCSPRATTASCTHSIRRPAAPTGPSRPSRRSQRAAACGRTATRQRHPLRRVLRRSACQRLRGGHRHRAAGLEAQGGRASRPPRSPARSRLPTARRSCRCRG